MALCIMVDISRQCNTQIQLFVQTIFCCTSRSWFGKLESHAGQRWLVGWRFVGQSKGIILLPWFIFIFMVPLYFPQPWRHTDTSRNMIRFSCNYVYTINWAGDVNWMEIFVKLLTKYEYTVCSRGCRIDITLNNFPPVFLVRLTIFSKDSKIFILKVVKA